MYPGTDVLRNLRDVRNRDVLNQFEAEATSRRIRELEHRPIAGQLETLHLRAVHRYIFRDVYSWAGDFRTVDISLPQGLFAVKEYIAPSLGKVFEELQKDLYLKGADLRRFANRAKAHRQPI